MITFSNGTEKIFDMERNIDKGGVFAALKDHDFFQSFHINPHSRTIEWPNGVEICPDTLYMDGIDITTVEKKATA